MILMLKCSGSVPRDCVLGIFPQSPVGYPLAPSEVPDQNSWVSRLSLKGLLCFPSSQGLTWLEGLMAGGLERDVALLATRSNKPSTLR